MLCSQTPEPGVTAWKSPNAHYKINHISESLWNPFPLLLPNWWIKRDKPFSAPFASWKAELNWICMDSAEQHIHLWRPIMLAGPLQDEPLFISRPAEMCSPAALGGQHLCVCSSEDGGVCLFHGSPPRIIQFVCRFLPGKSNRCKPTWGKRIGKSHCCC